MKLATLVVAVALLSGCAASKNMLVDNSENLLYGQGVVTFDPIPKEDPFWFSFQIINTDGDQVVLHCGPSLATTCSEIARGQTITYIATARPGSQQTLQHLSIK